MRRKIITILTSAIVAIAWTGAADAAPPAPSPAGGALPRAARPALPPQAVPGSTAQRRAAWQKLTPDGQRQAVAQFRAQVGARVIAAADAAAANRPAPPSWRDVVAGTTKHQAGTPALAFTRQPVPAGARAVSPLDSGDLDGDGLDQDFERNLADAFTPFYHISAGEDADTGFAIFGDFVPQTPIAVSGSVPPISYFRVQPLGGATANGVPVGVIRLDYLTLWNQDTGLELGGICGAAIDLVDSLLGTDIDPFGHPLDNERSAALVAAPLVNGWYNSDPAAYSGYSYFTAAHEGLPVFDESAYVNPGSPVPAGNHLILAESRSKHSTYTFNPDGFPIVEPAWQALTYSIIDGLFFDGLIDEDSYLLYQFLADNAFYGCVVESFVDQGGTYAGTRIDVGEPSHPLNGSGFINDSNSGILDKLARPLW